MILKPTLTNIFAEAFIGIVVLMMVFFGLGFSILTLLLAVICTIPLFFLIKGKIELQCDKIVIRDKAYLNSTILDYNMSAESWFGWLGEIHVKDNEKTMKVYIFPCIYKQEDLHLLENWLIEAKQIYNEPIYELTSGSKNN